MIRADGLHRSFGGRSVLTEVTFDVAPGEVVGLLGPNGAGKTTAIRLLLGLLRPHEGTVRVDGPVGWLPERFAPYDGLTTAGYLRFIARAKRAPAEDIDWAMETAGVADLARRPVGRLSKGQRQRLGLAQALLGRPPAYLLDEATTSLDPAQVVEARGVIRRLASDEGASVLVSTHVLAEAAAICDRVVVLAAGRVVGTEAVTDASTLESRFLHLVGAAELGKGP
jgi:ABC-2 type transport system ATP-binding protein